MIFKYKVIFILFLIMSSCAAQKKEIPENVLESDRFGDYHIRFQNNNPSLTKKAQHKLDCYLMNVRKHQLKTKEIIFITHNFQKTKEGVKVCFEAKNNILNYLISNEESIINTFHRFYYGTQNTKKEESNLWFFEVQIIFEYVDEKTKSIEEGTFNFDNCTN